MLTVSFIIPTYNAGFYIEKCLKSIRAQEYPQDKVEVLILDGGSVDNTLEIAKKYNCLVFKNEKKLAEYGVQLGIRNARGNLSVIFAADNELVGNFWIKTVTEVFDKEEDVNALWGKLVSGKDDSSLNKYFELIQSDPLNWFLNKNILLYKNNARRYNRNCVIFNVDPVKPLVWGANGLTYRTQKIRQIWDQEGYLGDNDAFQYMVENGDNKVAYFDEPFVYHHHVAKIGDWVKKWRRNFVSHLLDQQSTRNMNWAFSGNFKSRLVLWGVYSLLPVFSLSHSIYLAIKDKNGYWLYHSVVSFLQFFVYLSMIITTAKGRNFIKGIFLGR
ncbi:MAG: glycosyltransferase family 2 protein [Candidatus Omnitrophota bacterium]